MNANFGTPYRPLMGADTADTTAALTAGPNQAATIITSITNALASVANTALTAFGQPKTPTVATSTTGAPIVVQTPAQARTFDPMIGLAIGIPAALVLAAIFMGKKR